jgi:hypothetical protein
MRQIVPLHLGYFKVEEEAGLAFNAAARRVGKPASCMNDIATDAECGTVPAARKGKSSKFRGVYWNVNRWCAQIVDKGNKSYLGEAVQVAFS